MSTIRNQIMDHIKTKLTAVGAPSGLTVDLMRLRNLETVELPHVLIRMIDEDSTATMRNPMAVRRLRVNLECRAAATGSNTIEDALDSLLIWVSSALQTNPQFAGLAIDSEELGTIWDGEETASGTYGMATVRYQITYNTLRSNQESRK